MKTHMVRKNSRVVGIWQMVVFTLAMISAGALAAADDPDRIQPYAANPFYWQYKGEPVLLLGGSGQDNPFNHPAGLQPDDTLANHLDILKSVGGNYLRCTMSWRDPGNPVPFSMNADGKYDLNQPNPDYWNRFKYFLNETAARDIIVQIEVFDQYDYDSGRYGTGWNQGNPFNPALNVNYTAEESNLPTHYDQHGGRDHPFFYTAPAHLNNTVVLPYQQAFVDKMLSYSLQHRHVLYNISNECGLNTRHGGLFGAENAHGWADYWIGYIRGKAAEAGKHIETTSMLNRWFYDNPRWQADRPEQYSFLDISQLNDGLHLQHEGTTLDQLDDHTEARYNKILDVRQRLNDSPRVRPMNHVKVYGVGMHREPDGTLFFWRNLMAGCASVRFHRPVWGLGLNTTAQANIRSARMLEEAINIFSTGMEPRNDLLSNRATYEAYLLTETGKQYAIYFPKDAGDGQVTLDLSGAAGQWKLRWLNIMESRWGSEQTLQGGKQVQIKKPDANHWAAVILPAL